MTDNPRSFVVPTLSHPPLPTTTSNDSQAAACRSPYRHSGTATHTTERPPRLAVRATAACRFLVAAAALCSSLAALPAQADTAPSIESSSGSGLRLRSTPAAGGLWTMAAAGDLPSAGDPAAPAAEVDRWRTSPPTAPDWRGAKRDLTHFLSYQIVGVAVLYVLPASVTSWTDDEKQNYSFEKWRYNVTHPKWDSDTFFINYVLHPYWGGAYYVRARERGLDRMQSFWFSALMSVAWEYGAEALAEQVSIQDLIFTPALGSLLGEFVFSPLRERIKARSGPLDWTDRTLLVLTDPLGAINDKVDEWFGLKASVQLAPNAWRPPTALRAASIAGRDGPQRRQHDGWTLSMRVEW